MVLSSSILFLAGNLQTLSTMASCSNDSLLMIARSLPAFAKQFGARGAIGCAVKKQEAFLRTLHVSADIRGQAG
jgi:hypothetical protein